MGERNENSAMDDSCFETGSVKSLYPKQPGDFARWLARNPLASEVWLVFYKKTTGRQTVAYKHALQEPLCHGWIDSRVKSMDADRFTVRFTPRKPGSPWSKRNLKLVEALLDSEGMTEAGIAVLPLPLRRKASSLAKQCAKTQAA
jgi:uncharacterized protein YdeI (YjbR/CyaY-like superfamily)